MDPKDLEQILERLERIEERLYILERLSRVGVTSGPPPRIVPETPPPVPVAAFTQDFELPPSAPPPPPPPSVSGFDEMRFGGKALPLVGAVVFLLGIAFLVGLGISRGMLTPTVQFYGALAISFLFIVVGVVKRDEQQEFGAVLTGIGSCGLYLTAVGGHVFLDLYGSTALVGFALSIGMANFGYSIWRKSQSFYWLGVVGGLGAAYMPITTGDLKLVVWLQLLVVITALGIAGRAKWVISAALTWIIGALAAECLAWMPNSTHESLTLMLAHGALSAIALAWALRFEPSAEDPKGLAGGVILVITAIQVASVSLSYPAHPYVLMLSLVAAAAGFLMPQGLVRQHFHLAAVVSLFCVAPWSNPDKAMMSYMFATLGAVWAVATLLRPSVWMAWLALLIWIEGAAVMVWALDLAPAPRDTALGLSAALSVVSVLVAAAFRRVDDAKMSGLALMLASPVVATLSLSLLFPYDQSKVGFVASSFGLYLMAGVFVAAAAVLKLRYLLAVGWLVACVAITGFWIGANENPNGALLDASALFGLAILSLLTWSDTKDADSYGLEFAHFLFGLLGGSLLVRFAYEGLTALVGFERDPALALAFSSIVIAFSVWSIRWPSVGRLWATGLLGVFAGALTFGLAPQVEFLAGVYFGLVVAAVVYGWACSKVTEKAAHGYVASAVLAWVPFSLFGHQVLSEGLAKLSSPSALTFTWIVYGILVLTAGFMLRAPEVRIVALIGFALTIVKVMLVDIAGLDPVLRIAALLVLGLTLIAAGYAYIWFQRRSVVPTAESPPEADLKPGS